MNDLIWIGNTLYPRWFVLFVTVGCIPTAFLLTYSLFKIVQIIRRNMNYE